MRLFRRRPVWIALAAAAICMTIVAWITLRSGGPGEVALPRRAAPGAGVKLPADQSRPIDLSRLRQQLPDSAYWRDDAPTTDPAQAARRVEEERRWNVLYGKVLSGTASGTEIDGYYDRLRRRSEDYLHLAETALAQPLPERERALLVLAARMNRERLASLPREREQALARKRLQDQRRAEWQRQPHGPEAR
jgi:hypothetical protein